MSMLKVSRQDDQRVIKSILHRIADIPDGVTVCTADLGGNALKESTPLARGSDGLHHVIKTVEIVTNAAADATAYEVAKGHHFKVGDYFATDSCNGKKITNINKADSVKDTITLEATLGAAITAGTCAFQSAGANKVTKYKDDACIAGSNYDVSEGGNLWTDAWLFAVVRRGNAVVVNEVIEGVLSGVRYIV